MGKKRTKRFRNRSPKTSAVVICKLLLPSVVAVVLLVVLNSTYSKAFITIRLELDKFFFVCDFSETPRYEFLRTLPAQSVAVRHFLPIEVQFQKLFLDTEDSKKRLLSTNQSVRFERCAEEYSEIIFEQGSFNVGSLEIGDSAQVSLELRERDFKSPSPGKLKIKINQFASRLHLQILSPSARIRINNCSFAIENGPIVRPSANGFQRSFIVEPKRIFPIKMIKSSNNNLTVDFDFPAEILDIMNIFEVPVTGLPIKRLGLNTGPELVAKPANIYAAKCIDLRVDNQVRDEFLGQNVFFQFDRFRDISIDSLHLAATSGAKLRLQISGESNTLMAGLSESSLENITPTNFEKLLDSQWLRIFGLIGWLIPTSLGIYQVFRKGW